MTAFLPLVIVALLGGCNDCDRGGYEPLRVSLVSGEPAVAMADGCVIHTDIPPDTTNPDQHGEALRHIGQSVYECLTGQTGSVVASNPEAFYSERLWFRIDGKVPERSDGKFYYGYWNGECSTIDTNLAHIGPQPECIGVAQADWQETCWTQFYTVIGHEVAHGWLGTFHEEAES